MKQSFNHHDIERQVLDFLATSGIEPYDQSDISDAIFDGRIHRFRTREDTTNEKSGAVLIHTDGWPAGYVQDWRKGIKEYWKYDISGLDDEQRNYFNSEEYRKKCQERDRKAEAKRKSEKIKCSAEAANLWERLPQAPKDHPYILRKHLIWLNDTTLRYNLSTKALAVPLRNINGQIMSIQWISEDGEKRYFEGAGLDGAFWECWLYEAMEENPKNTILLGEGFATMLKIFQLMQDKPVVAAMSCYQLAATAKILREKYPEAKIIITADNDHQTERKHGKNPGIIYATTTAQSSAFGKHLADGVIYPEFTPDENGSDWDDYAILHGNDYTASKLNENIAHALVPSKIRKLMDTDRLHTVIAQDLRKQIFPPIKWAVPGFLPSGLSILGAPPKTGKSLLALQLAIGVAIGGYAFGKIPVKQGDVLYLALEDTPRRLQERIKESHAVDENDDLSRLTLAYTVPRQHEGGIEFIDWWLQEHPNARLVIIDTLQRFRKQLSNKANVYAEDYDVISEIKNLADKYDVAFLILHHLKKVNPKIEIEMDWIDLFSGSAGISGSADALFVLKRARQSYNAKLFRTGRDVEEKAFWLTLDGLGWVFEGEVETFSIPTWKKQILDFLSEHKTITPLQLSAGYDISLNTARQNLARLAKEGDIIKIDRGVYELRKKD